MLQANAKLFRGDLIYCASCPFLRSLPEFLLSGFLCQYPPPSVCALLFRLQFPAGELQRMSLAQTLQRKIQAAPERVVSSAQQSVSQGFCGDAYCGGYNTQKRIFAQNPFAHQIGVKRAYNSFIVFARALVVYEGLKHFACN